MIRDFESKDAFVKVLHAHLSPTTPIQSTEHLFGRSKQLQQIDQALYSPGRSIFVYGDRGVGKTSLALTAANSHQSARRPPVMQVCTPATTFSSLMAGVLRALSSSESGTKDHTYRGKVGVNIPGGYGGSIELQRSTSALDNGSPFSNLDLNSTVAMLLKASVLLKEDIVVLIDEFDRVDNESGRKVC